MTARDSIQVLLVGCGAASAAHSRRLRQLRGVQLSFASRDAIRAEEYRRQFGGRRSYGSYEAAIADDQTHVVLIATPTVEHRRLAELALQAGRHVIVEKPAFMSTADADVIGELAASVGRHVCVAENYFYKPIAEHLRRVVTAGDLGEVRFVLINATKRQRAAGWRADPSLSGGGALFEGGVHWISFASNIGLEVEDVHAHRVGSARGPDRSTLVVIRYANGAVGSLAHSWELPAPFGHLRLSKVQGTAGSVTFESNGLGFITTGRRRSIAVPLFGDPSGSRAMLADFLNAVRSGQPPRFTLAMARRDLALLEQATSSMRSENPGNESGGPALRLIAASERR